MQNETFDNVPDWARPMTAAELEREAMDYEANAAYDRYDGWGDPDFMDEYEAYHDSFDAVEFAPYVEPSRPIADDEIPF